MRDKIRLVSSAGTGYCYYTRKNKRTTPDKLKFKKPYGSAEQPADERDDSYQLGLRTKHLLTVTNAQRSIHIARLASRTGARAQTPHALVFTSDDMKEIMKHCIYEKCGESPYEISSAEIKAFSLSLS